MTEYDNTNRWTLNKNEKNRPGKQDADYNGSINVNGVEYWLNGWIKEGRNGKFISGSIKPKEEAKKPDPISSGPIGYSNVRKSDMDDEIPYEGCGKDSERAFKAADAECDFCRGTGRVNVPPISSPDRGTP